MTPEQKTHVARIDATFSSLMTKKYEAGQKEHGGNLFEVSITELVDFAIEEAIDQVVYLLTLKEQLENGKVDR